MRNEKKLGEIKKAFENENFYMEQVICSFKKSGKISSALQDVLMVCENSERECISEALKFIGNGKYEKELYKEALEIIEKKYNSWLVKSIHSLMISVELTGGDFNYSLDILEEQRKIWIKSQNTLMYEKKQILNKVIISVGISYFLGAFSIHLIPDNEKILKIAFAQWAGFLMVISNIIIYLRADKKMCQKKKIKAKDSQKLMLKYYEKIRMKDKKGLFVSLAISLTVLIFAVITAILNYKNLALILSVMSIFIGLSDILGMKIAKNKVKEEISKEFELWLVQLSLLLQRNNVSISIFESINTAGPILKCELKKLWEQIQENPGKIEPYNDFCKDLSNGQINNTMKLLYSLEETGAIQKDKQLSTIMDRMANMSNMKNATKNENLKVKMSVYYLLPMLSAAFKLMADMSLFLGSYLSNLGGFLNG
ncbi:hypothetical protein SAMN05216249_10751 [Acetitomaculum ruminis DSM 5522]|uniref:Type II secretion system protein GspF domain-containing protein n=1 Tax=Acetitomaculum ruminis DSM 5522 TaxID=1120918 RepID=A0A1I0XPQ6_9FIRM|nr:hypothetical protein [Acetitomaculum ruminis]SFB02667.1 hypothetical protein SAMN05216249_10751 [Acetitomaculum ruminis DSM 5522]